jgi:hypothetical protein
MQDEWRTTPRYDEGIARLKVLNASNKLYRDLGLETQLLQHGMMLDERTLEGFWRDQMAR